MERMDAFSKEHMCFFQKKHAVPPWCFPKKPTRFGKVIQFEIQLFQNKKGIGCYQCESPTLLVTAFRLAGLDSNLG